MGSAALAVQASLFSLDGGAPLCLTRQAVRAPVTNRSLYAMLSAFLRSPSGIVAMTWVTNERGCVASQTQPLCRIGARQWRMPVTHLAVSTRQGLQRSRAHGYPRHRHDARWRPQKRAQHRV